MTEQHLPHAPVGEFEMFASEDGTVLIACRFEGDILSPKDSKLEPFAPVAANILRNGIGA